MTQKPQIIKVIADALRAAVDTIDAAITELDTAIVAVAAEQPEQSADVTAVAEVHPEVVAAAVDVVAAADVATESYDEKLAQAIAILKGGK